MKPYQFHRAARAELLAAVEWYAQRSEDVAAEFAAQVEDRVAELAELPLAWPRWHARDDLRVRTLIRFPYSIIYRVQDRITIIAVAHQRRRPGYWLQRAVR